MSFETKIDVYHIKDLASGLISGRTQKIFERVQLSNQLKNYLNALVLDAEETYDSRTMAFSGLAEVMNENRIGIAAALRRPMTKLFGLSPAGFSNGDSDLESYYQLVESEARAPLKPVVRKVVELVCQHLFGYTPEFQIEFPPLKQLSELDQEIAKNHKTERVSRLYETGLLQAGEAIQILKKDGVIDIETAIERGAVPPAPAEPQAPEEPQAPAAPTVKKNSERVNSNSWNEDDHPRAKDGKFGEGGSKGQYQDIGKEIAKDLKAEDFGTPEEITEKAKPIRTAKNREEAKPILDDIASKGALRSADGVEATISSKSKREILSNVSFEQEAHWQAVANIDKLYGNAIEKKPVELDPNKDNKNKEARKFLYSPMEYKGRIIPVKFTVFEYKRDKNLRLYHIEAINIDLDKKIEGAGLSGLEKLNAFRDTSSNSPSFPNITHLFDSVNDYLSGTPKTVKIYRAPRSI